MYIADAMQHTHTHTHERTHMFVVNLVDCAASGMDKDAFQDETPPPSPPPTHTRLQLVLYGSAYG
jgi:hypothetical protein